MAKSSEPNHSLEGSSLAQVTTQWARLLLGSLAEAGVRQIVISPGSRSTPFTWAALRFAEARPDIHCHVVLDERSAGFVALGVAKATGAPALLICTSGSAAANYFPAVVEARAAGLPLLVLTSDRPFELQHAGAPQTMDQTKLFGDYAVGFFELGHPEEQPGALRGLRRMALQAAQLSLGPVPGPVQLNGRLRKPLEPELGGAVEAQVDRLIGEMAVGKIAEPGGVTRALNAEAAERWARRIAEEPRGVILCGPLTPWQLGSHAAIERLASLSGYAVWSESSGPYSPTAESGRDAVLRRFDLWLKHAEPLPGMRPRLVLQLGPLPSSAALLKALDAWEISRYVICPAGYHDSANRAQVVYQADIQPSVERLSQAIELVQPGGLAAEPARRDYVAGLKRLEAETEAALAELLGGLAEEPRPEVAWSEAAAVHELSKALPEELVLSVGNSLAIRELDWFGARRFGCAVYSQRGLNGIDGVVSAAVGVAMAKPAPQLVLLGDMSFLHDMGSLYAARQLKTPFVIALINNQGGRIFEQLPLAQAVSAEQLQPWTTPHPLNFRGAAELFQLPYFRASNQLELSSGLSRALNHQGASLLELVVAPSSSQAAQRALRARLSERLAGLAPGLRAEEPGCA